MARSWMRNDFNLFLFVIYNLCLNFLVYFMYSFGHVLFWIFSIFITLCFPNIFEKGFCSL